MNNIINRMTNFLKAQNIKYLINDDETKITLAYIYRKKQEDARVILFIQKSVDCNEVEMGFVEKISGSIKLEDALEKLLVLNNRLKVGKIGLADEEDKNLVFSIHFPIDDSLPAKLYQDKLEICLGVHSMLLDDKIIDNSSAS